VLIIYFNIIIVSRICLQSWTKDLQLYLTTGIYYLLLLEIYDRVRFIGYNLYVQREEIFNWHP